MRRSDMIEVIFNELDQFFTGFAQIGDRTAAEAILKAIEDNGMQPPPQQFIQEIEGTDAAISYYENSWEAEQVLPVGVNPVGTDEVGKFLQDNKELFNDLAEKGD